MKKIMVAIWCLLTTGAQGATWYVDSSATGVKNGTSWAQAWTALSQIKGVAPGDTVYISGGPSGSTRSYSQNTSWNPISGSAGAPISYRIGQDASHNGIALFNIGASQHFVTGAIKNVLISGDAGDGKQHFEIVQAIRGFDCSGSTNFHISHVSFPQQRNYFFYANGGGPGIEIDHCYCYKLQGARDDDGGSISIGLSGTGWDQNKIHDNTFHVPNSGNGTGDDCLQGGGQSISFYHNSVLGYVVAAYPRGQHQDGWQPLGGSYYKAYGNYFENIANYAVFGDAYYGDFDHFWVYNNITVITNVNIQKSDPPQGIAIGPDGGSYSNMGRWPKFTDVMIANNLIADYGNHVAINLRNNPGQRSTFTGCLVANNIVINSNGIGVDSAVQTAANVVTNLSSGVHHFVAYTPLKPMPPNNFHLSTDDTLFRGKGIDLIARFTTDRDLISRAGAWDIGPYKW